MPSSLTFSRGEVNRRRGALMGLRMLIVGVLVSLTACASNLSPLQERAWDAFKDCQTQAPSATLQQITEDGGLSYMTREGRDVGIMQQCLQERWDYRFR